MVTTPTKPKVSPRVRPRTEPEPYEKPFFEPERWCPDQIRRAAPGENRLSFNLMWCEI